MFVIRNIAFKNKAAYECKVVLYDIASVLTKGASLRMKIPLLGSHALN